jgi:hypothetical protein
VHILDGILFVRICMVGITNNLMMIFCRMAARGWGMSEVSVRQMKALTVKMATVTLIGKGM